MIKAENGMVHLEGTGLKIQAEFGCIVQSLKESMVEKGISPGRADETILDICKIGLMSEDELKKEEEKQVEAAKEAVKGLGHLLKDVLGEILSGGGKDDK